MATATTTTSTSALPPPSHHHASQRCTSCAPEPTSFDWAISVLQQPTPPSVREILTAYSKNGREDRELLLSLLAAKSAEDNRIAHQMALHRSLLHLQYDLPLSPPPEPEMLPSSSVSSHLTHSHSYPAQVYQHPYSSDNRPYPSAHKSYPGDRPLYASGDHSYPSPTTSSPPGMGSRSPPAPPSQSSLGKRGRSPAAYSPTYPRAAEKTEHQTPPSRSSPMSLRGILSDPQPSHYAREDDHPSKRRALESADSRSAEGARHSLSHSPREVTFSRVQESSVRLSPPGHRVSHERTRSRDGE